MAPVVILHFGMHKTGSTSIQESLAAMPPQTRFTYADLGTTNHSGALLKAFAASPETKLRAMRRRGTDADEAVAQSQQRQEQLAQALAACRSDLFILSGENIVRLSEDELRAMAAFLLPRCSALRVVGYIRPPFGYMESAFQERLKGSTHHFKPENLYPGYRSRFEKFERAFGRERMEYWLFDPASFPRQCAVTDFCTRLGIDLQPEQVMRANDGLSRQAASLLYAYRRFGAGAEVETQADHRQDLALNEVLKTLPGAKIRIASELAMPIIERQADDVAWMEQRLGTPFPPPPVQQWPQALRGEEDLWQFDADALHWLLAQIGVEHAVGPETTAYQVAAWVQQLRAQCSRRRRKPAHGHPSAEPRAAVPLRRLIRESGVAHGLPEDDAVALVKGVLAQVVRQLCDSEGGRLKVAGIGSFSWLPPSTDDADAPRQLLLELPAGRQGTRGNPD